MKPKILLIEDNEGSRFGFVRYFTKSGYSVSEAATLSAAGEALEKQNFNAIVLDINLPDGNGIDFIDTVREQDPSIPIIVITGAGDIKLAVKAMQKGADNFLTKPIDNAALTEFLRKTLEIGELKRKVSARQRLEKSEGIFFGDAPAMREILEMLRVAAASNSPILITGETGTGKGMLSKWVHRQSSRAKNEFVEINCSSLRGEMLSRELFGNARGAFTSADQDRKGLLDIADRGTLLLDEIGDIGMEVQAQFLKVLEDKSYRRLGDVKLLRSDFRLICSTNREIETLVQEGLFRQDLLYRINLLTIRIPPLRDRMDDLPALVGYLLHEMGSAESVVTDEVMRLLKTYSWPGNIRELKNILERSLLLTPRGANLRLSHFSILENTQRPALKSSGSPVPSTVQDMEKAHILSVLDQMGGDIDKAAKSLNLSRATVYRRLKHIKDTDS
ncbi:MAG: sigma-54-dependent Fis family transcriptional regulator [Verrucomicrobia bacterium]|nr:sigma-54-dependent Fis family transcriptional regulator [Deltaproteobacteria bacterium]